LYCRFTTWSVPAGGVHFYADDNELTGSLALQDCQVFGGFITNYGPATWFTNNLFSGASVAVGNLLHGTPPTNYFYNNLFLGGELSFQEINTTTIPWTFENNLFDQCTITNLALTTDLCSNNAYVTTNFGTLTSPTTFDDQVLSSSPAYEVGTFGQNYYPADSPLLYAGSMLATTSGLEYHTVTTNNVPDGTNLVSIGFHYMAPVVISSSEWALQSNSVAFTVADTGIPALTYQWAFDGTNIAGATSSAYTVSSVQTSNTGNYTVTVVDGLGTITSPVAALTMVVAPHLVDLDPETSGLFLLPTAQNLYAKVGNPYPSPYGTYYQWQLDGTNIPGATGDPVIITYNPTSDGTYTLVVTNAAGSTNVSWDVLLGYLGMVEAWGDNDYEECNRPASLTNTAAIAAGEYQSVAVSDAGTVAQWGEYWDGTSLFSVTDLAHCSAPPTGGIVAVAAGLGQALALSNNGTVCAWGITNDGGYAAYGTKVPSNLNLTNVTAIGCGWQFNVALLNTGTVKSWGIDIYGETNVPTWLNNVMAISAGPTHTLALQSNGTVVAWGYNDSGETNVPSGLADIVAVAAGLDFSLALPNNGTVVAWGDNTYGQCNVPSALTNTGANVMAIAAGDYHCVALLNTGYLVAWGDNSSGQTNTSEPLLPNNAPLVMKLIAAGGDHTLAAIWSPFVQYPLNVANDLLLIYNATNLSLNSSPVFSYYTNNRPMVGGANILAINCDTNEQVTGVVYSNEIAMPIQTWLSNNPTKRPSYVILFPDIPSRPDADAGYPSTQWQIHYTCMTNWKPFVTSINMNGTGGTNDCIAYINKLAYIGNTYSPGKLVISASAGGYGNANWYFDDSEVDYFQTPGLSASNAVVQAGVSPTSVYYLNIPDNGTLAAHITNGLNVAAYMSWGTHGYNGNTNSGYATNDTIQFSGQSTWYIMQTIESYNGQRNGAGFQGDFLEWFSSNAFGGINYTNTPIGALSNVEEPGVPDDNSPVAYFGLWASGKNLGICAWNAVNSPFFQAVGDPLTSK
jgi:hypothetical protein